MASKILGMMSSRHCLAKGIGSNVGSILQISVITSDISVFENKEPNTVVTFSVTARDILRVLCSRHGEREGECEAGWRESGRESARQGGRRGRGNEQERERKAEGKGEKGEERRRERDNSGSVVICHTRISTYGNFYGWIIN